MLEKNLLATLDTLRLIKFDLAGNEGIMDDADEARTIKKNKDWLAEHGPLRNDEQE